MTKPDPETTARAAGVPGFIAAIADARRREEAGVLDGLYRRVTGCEPAMWGASIIGYGRYAYRYESGREGVSFRSGFSPRKAALTLYLSGNFARCQPEVDDLLARLGPHTAGKGCLYIKRLGKVDLAVLERLLALNWGCMNADWPE